MTRSSRVRLNSPLGVSHGGDVGCAELMSAMLAELGRNLAIQGAPGRVNGVPVVYTSLVQKPAGRVATEGEKRANVEGNGAGFVAVDPCAPGRLAACRRS